MQFGSTPLTGASIAHSFSVDAFLDSIFMSGFIKCLSYDDYFIRPECHDEEDDDDSPCQGQNFPEQPNELTGVITARGGGKPTREKKA